MNEEKSTYYSNQILKYFIENNVVTTAQLSEELKLSEKTIRTKINSINDFLQENNIGTICKKPRVGVWLEATESQKVELNNYVQNSKSLDICQSSKERFVSALRIILKKSKNTSITTQQLASSLYLSVPTLLKVIKECKEWLLAFNINLIIVRNKGIELKYSEIAYRLAVKEFIKEYEDNVNIEKAILSFMPGIDVNTIKKTIIETEKEWKLEFADESFNQILVLVSLALHRKKYKNRNKFDIYKEEWDMLVNYNELAFAQSIVKKIESKFKTKLDEEESMFLAMQLLCSKLIDTDCTENGKEFLRMYDEQLKDFVSKLIGVVSNVLNIDLTEDESLFNGLLIHIRPAIFRIRYDRQYTHNIKNYIKSEFPETFRVSWLISVLFEEHYNLKISDDELSYITLYIQSALERNKNPINVILVSQQGMGINQFLSLKIKQFCPSIKDIEIVSYHDFNIKQYNNVKVILTTVNLGVKDSRIIYIESILSSIELRRINHQLNMIAKGMVQPEIKLDCSYHSFFEPDLIFTNIKVKNKEELIRELCNRLEDKGYVTKKYYKSVIEREKVTSTCSVKRVAIPHGEQKEINEAKVVIAILKEPMLWDEVDYVDIVFLLAVKMSSEIEVKKTQLFYKQYIKLVGSDEDVNVLRGFKSSEELYKYLIR